MLRVLLRVAMRVILKNKGYSLINIAGLAVGMAACVLILLWVSDELNFNTFNRKLDRIFAIPQTQHYQTTGDFTVMPTPAALSAKLEKEYPEIEHSARYEPWLGKRKITQKDRQFQEEIHFADQSLFDIFSFDFIAGDKATALKDPNSIVLTRATAERLFGGGDPVGKTVRMDDKLDLKVTGVMNDVPKNSDIRFDGLVPTLLMKEYGVDPNSWGPNVIVTYVLLRDAGQAGELSKKIEGILRQVNNSPSAGKLLLFPFKDFHLYSIKGSGGRIESVVLFSLIALFTLVIACINFMNLSTARSARRAIEVGVRKVVGATRFQIANQFFSESVFLTIVSLALALVLVEASLPFFNQIAGKELRLANISPSSILLIVGMTALTGILAGVYPSLFLSSLNPLSILRRSTATMSGRYSLRRLLVITQFVISISLIIATTVVSRQLNYIQDKDLGMDLTNLVYVPLDEILQGSVQELKNELLRSVNIVSVTSSRNMPTQIYNNGGGWSWEGKAPDQDEMVSFTTGDYDYLKTFSMKLREGRFYSEQFAADDSASIVINESFAKLMGMEAPVGKHLTGWGQHFTIIGVVSDFHFSSLRSKIGPLVIFLSQRSPFLFVKTNSKDLGSTLSQIQNACKSLDPKFVFEYGFMDKDLEQTYTSEQRLMKILNSFAVLAIIISCLGLIGLSSYVAEAKAKEVGIRKVLGATTSGLIYLLSKELISWVILANIIAWPIAYYFMTKWLENFAYRTSLGFGIFAFAALLAVVIGFIAVSYQAFRAALANPVKALRYE